MRELLFAHIFGKLPVNLLTCRLTSVRAERLFNSDGMVPERLSDDRFKIFRLVRLPIEVGIEPVRPLLLRISNLVKDVRFPISLGKVPTILLFEAKIILVTCPDATVMPYQVLIAVSVFQLVFVVQLAPFVLLYKATRASHSVCGTPVVAVAVQSVAALALFAKAKKPTTKNKQTRMLRGNR